MSQNTVSFAGSIAENYQRHLVPLIFEDYARDLAARVDTPPHGSVLETACGTGALTRHLRPALPEGASLVATDVNPGMLEAARARSGGARGVEYRIADATALPFPDESFDVVACHFGVMFYPDKDLGYREAARVLRPGGSYVFNVWDSLASNPLPRVVHETVVDMFPDDPPEFLALPFSYNDIPQIETQLRSAGFRDVQVAILSHTSQAGSARDVALGFLTGTPLAAELARRSAEDVAMAAVEAALTHTFGTGTVCASMQSIAFLATKP